MSIDLRREPRFEDFLKVLRREGRPSRLPFYEHVANPVFVANRTGTPFNSMSMNDEGYWDIYVDFWLGMGYDCIPMEIPLNCPMPDSGQGGAVSHGSESQVVIRNREDFARYPWPDESAPIDFRHFETVAGLIPEGCMIVGGVCGGPYEWASNMLGTIGMSYLLLDDPELVEMVFRKIGSLHIAADKVLAEMEFIGTLRQGDDLGFKTSTFLKPEDLRKLVFPTYRQMAGTAHQKGKPFILHSCGNLTEVYEDIIDCGIDAKHSFEDVIMPVPEFKQKYGGRMTPLGGLDVDFICRRSHEDIRRYTREMIEKCFCDGHWALGTGNSLPAYMPVENYLVVLEEGLSVGG